MTSMMQKEGREQAVTTLLRTVSQSGWTEETASRFEREYGDDIRRLVVLYLWKLGLVAYRFDPRRAERLLQSHCLEVFESTVSDVWMALTHGLVASYLRELGSRPPDGLPFRRYLAGAVRNLVVENARKEGLLPRESEGSLLRGFCAARREGTQRAHLARAMYQLQMKAERELLAACPEGEFECVYENLYRLVHHFFERYIPGECPRIEKLRGSTVMAILARMYMDGDFKAGLDYTAALTPWDPGAAHRVLGHGEDNETDVDEEEFLTLLALREGKLK
jgi:hypothetical protein